MAGNHQLVLVLLLAISRLFLCAVEVGKADNNIHGRCGIEEIYQFGDSISDTGNLLRDNPDGAGAPCSRLPYGITSSKHPTGRWCDGLLMIDYVAKGFRLPLLNAYKNSGADFRHGVNFAVAGATALLPRVLARKNIMCPVTNSSLDIQIDWMEKFLKKTCFTQSDCAKKLENALFIVGEIGGNEYNFALFQGNSIDHVMKDVVPDVVKAIMNAVKRVINVGGKRIVVPGNFPLGCLPIFLTIFQTNISTAYDEHHCLKALNSFSMYHNHQLRDAIQELARQNPKVTILYGDYYNAYRNLLRLASTPNRGFDVSSIQKACCGSGGKYNFDLTRMCGAPQVPVCENPNNWISWDGIHFTQHANHMIATKLLRDMFISFKCSR